MKVGAALKRIVGILICLCAVVVAVLGSFGNLAQGFRDFGRGLSALFDRDVVRGTIEYGGALTAYWVETRGSVTTGGGISYYYPVRDDEGRSFFVNTALDPPAMRAAYGAGEVALWGIKADLPNQLPHAIRGRDWILRLEVRYGPGWALDVFWSFFSGLFGFCAAAFFGYMGFRLAEEFFEKEERVDADSH